MGARRQARGRNGKRVAVGVVVSLLASVVALVAAPAGLSVLGQPVVGSAAAAAGSGLSTLAGSGAVGMANGSPGSATFDTLGDAALSPDGSTMYVLDVSSDSAARANTVRKVNTATGTVSTLASGGMMVSPYGMTTDDSGNVYVSVSKSGTTYGGAIIKIDASGAQTAVITDSVPSAIAQKDGWIYYTGVAIECHPGCGPANELFKAPVAGASAGTQIGGYDNQLRGEILEMSFAGDGNLYLSWRDAKHNDGVGFTTPLLRYDGAGLTELLWTFAGQLHFTFPPNSSTMYSTCDAVGAPITNGCDSSPSIVRRQGYGVGSPLTMVGDPSVGAGFAEGLPGQMSSPQGVVVLKDSRTLLVEDRGNHRIRKTTLPDDPAGLIAGERSGGCTPASPAASAQIQTRGDPVDTFNGNYFETYQDVGVAGRTSTLDFSRTYNAQRASVDGPLGYGWAASTGSQVTFDTAGNATVQQENCSQVTFVWSGTTFTPAAHVDATLTKAGSGASATYSFVRRGIDTFLFDSTGRQLSMTDRNGYVTSYAYDGSGHLATVTDASSTPNRALTFTWTGTHITRVADNAARHADYTYDAAGNLGGVTDVAGNTWAFTYDTAHQLVTVRDPVQASASPQKLITNVYDAVGRVTSQTDRLGRQTLFDYTAVPNGTKVTDPKGNITVDTFLDGLRTSTTIGGVPGRAGHVDVDIHD
jgi:YD repeat-containing protein